MSETKMTPEAALALRKPFPKESIGKLPKGGVMLDYVGHAATTDRLLTVDPHWSWEPMATDEHGLPLLDRAGNLWIRLTICGVTRIGVGDGKSAKELIGDAIRNAAMRFGVALDLWSKDDLVEFAQAATQRKAPSLTERAHEPEPGTGEIPIDPTPAAEPVDDAPLTATTRKRMFALLTECGITDEADQRDRMGKALGREVASRSSLTEAEARVVIGKLTELRDWQRAHGEGK